MSTPQQTPTSTNTPQEKWYKRPEFKILLNSIGVTLFIATVFAIGVTLVFGMNFFGALILGFVLQIVVFFVINSFLIARDQKLQLEMLQRDLDVAAKYTVTLNCAYCRQVNKAIVVLNQRNTFKCDHCNQVNSIQMMFSTAQVTTPLESVGLPLPDDTIAEIKI